MTVRWNKKAEQQWRQIAIYIANEFGYYEYRSLVIYKHCKLVYYIKANENTIRIAALWDTRREPERLIASI